MPYKDLETGRKKERERHRKRVADRRAKGLCPKCGKHPPASERSLCASCLERGRKSERARYERGKVAGDPYGGRNPKGRRRMARERNKRRRRERKEAGLCTGCGELPPAGGSVVCEVCREARRAEERKLYADRRAKGLCGRCGSPVFAGASRCGPCAALEEGRAPKKNAASRRRYADRRAKRLCVDCAPGLLALRRGVRPVRAAPGTPRTSIGECPSIRPAIPWSNSPRARSTDPGTPGRMSPCASPSRSSRGRKWKSSKTLP